MHLFIVSCLLIINGIVDANVYNQRAQLFNQLNGRRQRSIGIPYPYGYHYNPIEPIQSSPIDVSDSLSENFDSRINSYKPTYDNVKMTLHDVHSVPRTHSYQPKNSLYDSEYISVQEIPSLSPEDNYDYKHFASPLNKYLTPLTTENDFAINLVSIKKTSVLGYEFPTYKSPYSYNSVLSSKYPNTFLAASQSAEVDPEISKVSSPTVIILQLLPEKLEQESTTTTENPYDLMFKKLFKEKHNVLKNSVEDESNHEITQETPTEDNSDVLVLEENQTKSDWDSFPAEYESGSVPTEDESGSIPTEESVTEDQSISLEPEDNSTEDQSNPIITEDESNSIATEDESNSIATEESVTEDQSVSLEPEDNLTEDQSNPITKEDESNSIATEESQTKYDWDSLPTEYESGSVPTEDESDSIPTEDESGSIATEESVTENQSISLEPEDNLTEDQSNSITTEVTQTEDPWNSRSTEETQTKDQWNYNILKADYNSDEIEDY